MAQRRTPPGRPPIEVREFTRSEIDRGISKLLRRIKAVYGLDPGEVRYDDAQIDTVTADTRETIREVFGERSPEFKDHGHHRIWHGGYNTNDSDGRRQQKFTDGIPQTAMMLEGLISRLEEKREDLEPELDRRILEAERAPPRMQPSEAGSLELHPWGVVCALLFERDSDDVVDIVSFTGMPVTWSLTANEAYSHSTRKRAYRPRLDAAFNSLSAEDRLRVTWVVASELIRRDEAAQEQLSERLRPIGWEITPAGIAPANREVSELFLPGGTPYDAYVEIRKIIQSARKSVAVIDPYLDGSILPLLAASPAASLQARFLTWKFPADFAQELQKFGAQHQNIAIEARRSREFHDRFIIIDDSKCFHVGASLKDAGDRAFMISQVEDAENVRALLAEQQRAWNGSTPI